jgi:hypothetical protein
LGPSKASKAFGPIEAVGVITKPGVVWFSSIISKQDFARILVPGRNHQDALPTLRDASKPRIDQPIRPSVIKLLKPVH